MFLGDVQDTDPYTCVKGSRVCKHCNVLDVRKYKATMAPI